MNGLTQDIRYALRSLRKRPGFAAVAILTLALGIGANTSVFSMVNAVSLRPFPYGEPERIVTVGSTDSNRPGDLGNLSFPDFRDVREQAGAFAEVAAWDWHPYNLRGGADAVFVGGGRVSAGFFDVLGVEPMLGRTFRPEEDRPDGAEVVILSESLWRSQFGADPAIVGETVVLDGIARTVVGVMPRHVAHPERARLWVPLAMDAERSPRGMHWLGAFARLADDATPERAGAELAAIADRIAEAHPGTNRDRGLALTTLREAAVGEAQPLFLLLLAAVGFVLLIACANLANLVLARTAARDHEIAMRAALGAGRGRIVRQLLTESAVIGAAGCALGFLLGQWGIQGILAWIPVEIPAWIRVEPDGRVLGFTAVAAMLAVALFGLPPALHASRPNVHKTLKRTGAGATGARGRHRLRAGLIVAEVALSLVLLVGAGLMIRSLLRLSTVDPGFATENRVMATLSLPSAVYADDAARAGFQRDVLEQVRSLPGVASAGAISRFPLRGSSNAMTFRVAEQTPEEQRDNPWLLTNAISPTYTETVGIPLLRGRTFTDADRAGAPPVAIINDVMAERYWPGENPIGRRLAFGGPGGEPEWIEVVGVVGSVRHYGLEERPSIQAYLPFAQSPSSRMSVVVHTAGPPAGVLDELRTAVAEVDPNQALYDVMTLDAVVSEGMWQWRFFTRLFWIFAALALALAAVGIYGVIAYAVGQRTRELGVRVALGAERGDIARLVVRQGLGLILLGIAIGLPLALAASRLMAGVVYEADAFDPATIAGVVTLLAAIGLLACYAPARRAARVDPMRALRSE